MAGICEHVQYKLKLWLGKMEIPSNEEEKNDSVERSNQKDTLP